MGGRWIDRQRRDTYVKRARSEGYRSRAAFKLKQIDDRHRLFRRGAVVVDLGAAPGGWSQVAVEKVGPKGLVIAVDLLEMDAIPGVITLHEDIRQPECVRKLRNHLGSRQVDLVLSDMAPNITGIRDTDQANFEELVDAVVNFAQNALSEKGVLAMKLFQGQAFDAIRGRFNDRFASSQIVKPDASRNASSEVYIVARRLSRRGT